MALLIRELTVAVPALCIMLLLVIVPATKLSITLTLLKVIAVLTTNAFRVAVPVLLIVAVVMLLLLTKLSTIAPPAPTFSDAVLVAVFTFRLCT